MTTYITDFDLKRLTKLLETAAKWPSVNQDLLGRLETKLGTAKITSQKDVPPYLVTMNCHVRVTDLDEKKDADFWLVYPDDASSGGDKISVLSETGVAILGTKVGDILETSEQEKKRQLRIAQIYYQPEENNHFRL